MFKNQFKMMNDNIVDIVLIGGGIMSATLGTYLMLLEPNWTIHMYERLEDVAEESSNAWNNAGTGHAAFCELNYTSLTKEGDIDISKAIAVNESFEISLQFWAYLVEHKILNQPKTFINDMPHISLVWGKKDILFLRKRFNKLKTSTLFSGITYSEDPKLISKWIPLVMQGRNISQGIAATRMTIGTDINFGEITRQLISKLKQHPNFHLYLKHNVINIKRNSHCDWDIHSINNNQNCIIRTRYVFIGAGGASLKLLQISGIPEMENYAGFPVGGQFLLATNPVVVNNHNAKVYGKASVGTPPISVPHIDTRILDGQRVLLFGPFATFSGKFLKYGSWLDLFHSLTKQNISLMLKVGLDNFTLVKYLISQLLMTNRDRFNALKNYYPQANMTDWSKIIAGQRVQIIKKCSNKKGILQFGTEIVSSADGSLSALLGASPGASTSAFIMLELLKTVCKKQMIKNTWQSKLKEIIPSYGKTIDGNLSLTNKVRSYTSNILKLNYIESMPIVQKNNKINDI